MRHARGAASIALYVGAPPPSGALFVYLAIAKYVLGNYEKMIPLVKRI